MRQLISSILFSLAAGGVGAATPVLVRDINPGTPDSTPTGMFTFEGKVLFSAADGAGQSDFWGSDGSLAGTIKLKDFPAGLGVQPGVRAGIAHGAGYFFATDPFDGPEPFETDGSGVGLLSRVAGGGGPTPYGRMIPSADVMVFPGRVGNQNIFWRFAASGELAPIVWETTLNSFDRIVEMDGRVLVYRRDPEATRGISEIDPVTGDEELVAPYLAPAGYTNPLAGFHGQLWFVDAQDADGMELSFVGPAGTVIQLGDLNPGLASSMSGGTPFARVDDRLFFIPQSVDYGAELWVSDGTIAGTLIASDIRPGIQPSTPGNLVGFEGRAWFFADDGLNGRELWVSDGTPAGTKLIADHTPGAAGSDNAATIRVFNDRLFVTMGAPTRLYLVDTADDSLHLVGSGFPFVGQAVANGQLLGGYAVGGGVGVELYALDLIETVGPRGCLYPEASIPDQGQITSTFTLPAHGTISALQVSLDIGHSYASDLEVTLTHDDTGTQARVFQTASCPGDLVDIRLDDTAPLAVNAQCSNARPAYPRDASYAPPEPLSIFAGETFAGRWTLTVKDTAAIDRGTLHAWCLFADIDPASLAEAIFVDGFETP